MQQISSSSLENLPARISYLSSFLELTASDGEALLAAKPLVAPLVPAILDAVYKKLLSFDITAQAFVPRNTGYEGQVVKSVQEEIFPLDKNIFRTEKGLLDSLAKLNQLWSEVQKNPTQGTPQELQRSREAVSLVAAARWAYFAGLERKETRGMHKRLDYPQLDPNQRHYLAVGGLDKLWVRPEPVPEAIVPLPVQEEAVVAA